MTHVSGEARRQEKIVRRVEVELEGARGAIAQSNAKRDEAELQLRNEQQKMQQMQQQHQQQQQQHRMRVDELVRRCDDATTAAADAKAAVAAAVARAEEAEVQLAFPPQRPKIQLFVCAGRLSHAAQGQPAPAGVREPAARFCPPPPLLRCPLTPLPPSAADMPSTWPKPQKSPKSFGNTVTLGGRVAAGYGARQSVRPLHQNKMRRFPCMRTVESCERLGTGCIL